jgi:hypothetical protein
VHHTFFAFGLQVIAELQEGLEAWDKSNRWVDQGIIEQVSQNPQLKWAY